MSKKSAQISEELPRSEEFRAWLHRNTSFRERSINDTVSRAKRAFLLIDILSPRTENELVYNLHECNDFTRCTPSVRSQLKRAAMLYRNFRSGNHPSKGR